MPSLQSGKLVWKCDYCNLYGVSEDFVKKHERKEMIERILDDIYTNLHSYRSWVLDVIKNTIESWDNEQLKDWLGD